MARSAYTQTTIITAQLKDINCLIVQLQTTTISAGCKLIEHNLHWIRPEELEMSINGGNKTKHTTIQ